MFKMIDADNSGHITLEELKKGLEKVGSKLKDSEINSLMQAVCRSSFFIFGFYLLCSITSLLSLTQYNLFFPRHTQNQIQTITVVFC